MARPTLPAAHRRSVALTVLVTPHDRDAFAAAAKQQNKTVSTWMRDALQLESLRALRVAVPRSARKPVKSLPSRSRTNHQRKTAT